MEATKTKTSEVVSEVLMVVRATEPKGKGKYRNELRVVRWNGGAPVLENRSVYTDLATGEDRCGKCRGLTQTDLSAVMAQRAAIEQSMSR